MANRTVQTKDRSVPIGSEPAPLRDAAQTLSFARQAMASITRSVTTGGSLSHAPKEAQIALARGLTASVMSHFWTARCGHARMEMPATPPGVAVHSVDDIHTKGLAKQVGGAAAKLDPVEAAYVIGSIYASSLPSDHRAAHGVYYTPPSLAARLLDLATEAGVDWSTAKVLDPACGGGAFLTPVALRMAAALGDCNPGIILRNISARLRGFEIDPFGAWMSQVTLEAALLDICRAARRRLPSLVTVQDSLSLPLRNRETEGDFDLVIGNPPYGRTTLSKDMRDAYARSLYGHANMYGMFTDLALRLAKRGGVVAYVTPTSFLGGEYFKNLRGLLRREATPAAIEFINHRKGVFADVLQEALLATYRRAPNGDQVKIGYIEALEMGAAHVSRVGSFALPKELDKPWVLPRSKTQIPLVRRLKGMPHRLSSYGYRVSTGPLVWNRHKPQLSQTQTPHAIPVVWAEAITPDGRFIYSATRRNHAPWFAPRPKDRAMLVREPCVLVQRTTAKEQARRLVAAEMPASFIRKHGAVTVENHVNMVRPATSQPGAPGCVIAALLNSDVVDQLFRCINGSVAVSANEIEALPLPSPKQMQALEHLVQSKSPRETVNAAIAAMYLSSEPS